MFGKNLIRLFVRHRNAANLLMALIFVAGGYSLTKLNTQFFPDFGLDIVSIRVDWPGASTGDVEANIIEAIEPEIRFLDGVDRVTSYATEGVGRVVVEYEAGTDMQAALSEAGSALQQIAILPEDSERPVVRRIIRYDTIVRLVLSGPYSEAVLKRQAKRMRDELLAAGIDRVTFFGARDEEIRVKIEPRVLRQLDLTPAAVAARIGASNRDIPSGNIEGSVEEQLRSVGLQTTSRDLGNIEIRSLDDGQKIYLRAGGPPGREIDIRLRGGAAEGLKAAATEVKTLLGRFPGIGSIDDDLPYGKQELILEVTPRGKALGFTTQSAGMQVRNAFQGAIAQRFARGDEEVEIRVRYPRGSADSASFLNLFLRAPDGTEVPLSEVVTLSQERGFSRLRREDGAREVAIRAEIDETVTSLGALLPAITDGGLADIAQRFGLSYRFKGKAEEQAESAADMRAGAITGLLAIYIVLARVFANFSRPLIVMAIIPFGFVGMVLGICCSASTSRFSA